MQFILTNISFDCIWYQIMIDFTFWFVGTLDLEDTFQMSGSVAYLLLSYPRKWINWDKKQNIYRARHTSLFLYNIHRSSFTTFSTGDSPQSHHIALHWYEDKQQEHMVKYFLYLHSYAPAFSQDISSGIIQNCLT